MRASPTLIVAMAALLLAMANPGAALVAPRSACTPTTGDAITSCAGSNTIDLMLDGANAERFSTIAADAFTGLTAVQAVYMSNNDLTQIPDGLFAPLVNLRYVFLTNVPLTSFNAAKAGIGAHVEVLNLAGGTMTSFEPGAFDGLFGLKTLSIGADVVSGTTPTAVPLASLRPRALRDLGNLETLNLAFTAVTTFPTGFFDNQTKLNTLNLVGSPIENLPEGIFQALPADATINVDSAALQSSADCAATTGTDGTSVGTYVTGDHGLDYCATPAECPSQAANFYHVVDGTGTGHLLTDTAGVTGCDTIAPTETWGWKVAGSTFYECGAMRDNMHVAPLACATVAAEAV